MRLQQSQADRSKQNMLDRQRQQEKTRKEEEVLRKGAFKKEREVRKRIREEHLRQAEQDNEYEEEDDEDEGEEGEEEESRQSRLGQSTCSSL